MLTVVFALAVQVAEPAPLAARRAAVEALIADARTEVAIAYRTLDGAEEWLLDPDKVFHAASTMKVAVMVELFRQDRDGLLKLTDSIPVRNEFRSVVDGSTYRMNLGDDSDDAVYRAEGLSMSLEALNHHMITVSSNLATNILIDRLGVERIRGTVAALGVVGHEVRRGVEDQKAFERGVINETSARGLLLLLEAIARGRAVSKEASERMIEVLAAQKFRAGIPAGLPPGTRVAHKTGTITRLHHDAGIVYGTRPCILVILTRGFATEAESDAFIARATRTLLP